MDKKELRRVITEAFDKAVFNGKTEFTVEALENMLLSMEPQFSTYHHGVYAMAMGFLSGTIILEGDKYDRVQMINIFTEFVWCVWFDYKG